MSRQDATKGIHDLVQEANGVTPNTSTLKTLALHAYFHGLGRGTVDVSFLASSGVTVDEFISGIPDLKQAHEAIDHYAGEPDQHQKDLGYSQVYKVLTDALIKVR